MKINIAASHRFHLLDLARELEALGHEVRFYSYVPTKRAITFGLSKKASFSLAYILLPILGLVQLTKRKSWTIRLLDLFLDYSVAYCMKPCDVFIGLGTVYKVAFTKAKTRFNAITILEWGSKHITEQRLILDKVKGAKKQSGYFNNRALHVYETADYIAISSGHVKDSFVSRGIPVKKLLQNPYGVDLSMFSPTKLTKNNYDIIMVGGWSYTKGADFVIEFLKNSQLTLLHVGAIGDLPFPSLPNMTHIDPVDQSKLINYYAQAKVFILPSRAEGLAMVQLQAIACGLPVVCSKDTGGRDLKEFLEEKQWVIEMQDFSLSSLEYAITEALFLANEQKIGYERNYAGEVANELSWKAYGKRYNDNINRI